MFLSWSKYIVSKHPPHFNIAFMKDLFGIASPVSEPLRRNLKKLRFYINVKVSVMVLCLKFFFP